MLDEIFGSDNFLNEIIWSYRSGGRTGRWFARKHDTILLYARKIGAHTFNRMRGGRYRTLDLQLTTDGQPYKSTRNGRIHFHPDGPVVPDVWEIPFLSTVSKERTRYPTQKPEALLERMIQASSDRGDLVGDFFCGSGTTLVTAKRLGRHWLGCDRSSEAVKLTRKRLAQTPPPCQTDPPPAHPAHSRNR
jgi:DNA modification methylase